MIKEQADIDTILEKYPGEPRSLINILQDVQAEYGYVSAENMTRICDHTDVPLTQAWSVVTFYKSFSLEPRGEHEVKVCCGTACHLKGSGRIVEKLCRDLHLRPGETTSDQKFTMETVNCLGACALAPVAVVDEKYHTRATSAKIDKIITALSAG